MIGYRDRAVTCDPAIQGGRPVLRDTRWPTETVLAYRYHVPAIKAAFPWLSVAQIEAACRYERSLPRRAGRGVWRLRVRLAAWVLGVDVATLGDAGWG